MNATKNKVGRPAKVKAEWKAREKLPGECPPRTISVLVGTYEPWAYPQVHIRPGAQDFLSMPSRGF